MKNTIKLMVFAILFCLLFTMGAVSDVNKFTVKFTITFKDCTFDQAAKIEKELIEKYQKVDISVEKNLIVYRENLWWNNIPNTLLDCDSVLILDGTMGIIKDNR